MKKNMTAWERKKTNEVSGNIIINYNLNGTTKKRSWDELLIPLKKILIQNLNMKTFDIKRS